MPAAFDGDSHPDDIQVAVDARLRNVDPGVSAFRLRNRCRADVGTWIVSVAAPSGHAYDLPRLESAVAELGMLIEGVFEYDGDLQEAIWNDLGEPPFDEDDLPTTSEDQDCAFCGTTPSWVHPLDAEKSSFSHNGQRYLMPTFWTICDRCEGLYVASDDAQLAAVNRQYERESLEASVAAVAAFRAADLGRRELAPSRYPD